jgi:hypothetical protein
MNDFVITFGDTAEYEYRKGIRSGAIGGAHEG